MSSDDDNDADDLLASIGGTLMSDLLADLNVGAGEDTGWLSLEQLEQELDKVTSHHPAFMTSTSTPLPAVPEHPPTAASMVVGLQQQHQSRAVQLPPGLGQPSTTPTPLPQDAWSRSFQNFGSAQDFLQADSARKVQQFTPSKPPGMDWSMAEDYNIAETTPQMHATPQQKPPALTDSTHATMLRPPPHQPSSVTAESELIRQAAAKLSQQLSINMTLPTSSNDRLGQLPRNIPRPEPPTPQNSVGILGASGGFGGGAPTPPPTAQNTPQVTSKPVRILQSSGPMVPHMPMPPASSSPSPRPQLQQRDPHYYQQQSQTPVTPVMAVPVAMPVASSGPAWQSPAPQQQPQHSAAMTKALVCNPHPRAPAIPADRLASTHMSSRDILFVVHAMMKPVLAAGVHASDYNVAFLRKHVDANASVGRNKTHFNLEAEFASRVQTAKEWSEKQSTLGHTPKTNVMRPRALLSQTPVMAGNNDDDPDAPASAAPKQQRAAMWKARIYSDQAYQAYDAVVECWRTARPDTVPRHLQPHLVKLLKCLGVSHQGNDIVIDHPEALPLLLKLDKGKVLVARLFEQALLPPPAVPVILPHLLATLYDVKVALLPNATDDRMFAVLARVLASMSSVTGLSLLAVSEVMLANEATSLATAFRMQCVHAVLQRGSGMMMSDTDADASWQEQWKGTEQRFMQILSGME